MEDDALQKLRELSESYGEVLSDYIASGAVSQSTVRGLTRSINSFITYGHKRTSGYQNKEYISFSFGLIVLRLMLDDGLSQKEAMLQACLMEGKDEAWLKAVKHNKYYYSKAIVDKVKDHPLQKELVSRKLLDQNELRRCTTLSKLTKKQEKALNLHKMIVRCEDRIKALEKEVKLLNAENAKLAASIAPIRTVEENEELAMRMLKEGQSPTYIAKTLNVNRRTIYKWRDKELKRLEGSCTEE